MCFCVWQYNEEECSECDLLLFYNVVLFYFLKWSRILLVVHVKWYVNPLKIFFKFHYSMIHLHLSYFTASKKNKCIPKPKCLHPEHSQALISSPEDCGVWVTGTSWHLHRDAQNHFPEPLPSQFHTGGTIFPTLPNNSRVGSFYKRLETFKDF